MPYQIMKYENVPEPRAGAEESGADRNTSWGSLWWSCMCTL